MCNPNAVFFVKGDERLKLYLQETCYVNCADLSAFFNISKAHSPVKFKYHFCPAHAATECSYFKSIYYFEEMTMPYKSLSTHAPFEDEQPKGEDGHDSTFTRLAAAAAAAEKTS